VEIGNGKEAYDVTASVPSTEDKPGGSTQNRLRVAGTSYPLEITRRYTSVPKGAIGPEAQKLLNDLIARAKANNADDPFDFATLIVNELHNNTKYSYQTNVLGLCDQESSIVECFAKHRAGYCEYYASTMVMLLRAHQIPARLVEGYLPGSIDPMTFNEQVTGAQAHAWVEVYFPGYGWQMFDPTGGNVSRAPVLPTGTVIPTPSRPAASAAPGASPRDAPNQQVRPNEGGGSGGNRQPTGSGIGPYILVGAMLILVVGVLVFLAWRRGPRSANTADGVYASITGLARRFGFGPRPTQTAFEYATALGDVLPNVRPELHTVASAKVEVAYGKRVLGEDRLRAVREAYRRLRVSLLRLAFRRRDRRRLRGR
jgi:transglutaminase-like putative cysteine protease